MESKMSYKKGDYLIDHSCIYEVTGVLKGEKNETYIHFKPASGTDKVFTASMPIESISKSGLRKVATKAEIEGILKQLGSKGVRDEYSLLAIKEEVYQNEPAKVVEVIKYLWSVRDKLGKADRELMEQIIYHLCLEMAFVTKEKIPAVRRRIEKVLTK